MPVVDVKNLDGKTVGQVELSDAVFGARVKPHLLHEVVRWYLAGQRAGTHKVKGRGEVEGSGRKLWRQKGTGRARVGSVRSPLWRHGGTVHGPVPRDYSYRIPRKVLLGALRSALSAKLAEQKLTVVDSWELESHKTKPFRQALDRIEGRPTALLVSVEANRNLERASRNLAGVKLVRTNELQPYDLLRHDRLVMNRDAALRLSAALGPRNGGETLVSIQSAPASEPAPTKKPRAARRKKD
jgi:large subunit ribosomal protein L4